MAKYYQKEQYDYIKAHIRTEPIRDVSRKIGIPIDKIFYILGSLKCKPDTKEEKEWFIVTNCRDLDYKKLGKVTRMTTYEVYEILEANGLATVRMKPRRDYFRRAKDFVTDGLFNVHERENWLI